jgi:hypothetical protein
MAQRARLRYIDRGHHAGAPPQERHRQAEQGHTLLVPFAS